VEIQDMLTVRIEDSGQAVILRCCGKLVRGWETALLCAALRTCERCIRLDLSGVSAIDAAGIGALVSLQASGKYLVLVNPPASVRELLRRTNVDSILEICEAESASSILPTSGGSLHETASTQCESV